MSYSQVQICNIALVYAGQSIITSLSDGSQQADACATMYDIARQSVLEECNWNFATKISVPLAMLAHESIMGWSFAYAWPSDCLFPIEIIPMTFNTYASPVNPTWPQTPYPLSPLPPISSASDWREIYSNNLNQKILVSNVENAYINYVADITDTSQFSPQFVQCLTWKLASIVAQVGTGNKDLATYCTQMFSVYSDKAKQNNAYTKHITNTANSDYVASR
jgi:hypothetical protein